MVLIILLVTKKVKLLNRCVLSYLKWFWFCYENGKEELSTGSFSRMQIQHGKDKNDQIHRSWTRIKSESELESGIELELKSDSG